jgi:hypothetical protein
LDGGERAAFFHHILNLDLNGFEVRNAPQMSIGVEEGPG